MLSSNNLLRLLAVMVALTLLISGCDALEGIELPDIEPPIEEPPPEGDFYLIIRLYAAKPEVLSGEWTPPPVRKV